MLWLLLGIVVVGLVWFGLFPPRVLGPDEMGVNVFFGKPIKFCDSGIVWFVSRFPKEGLRKYPKKRFALSFRQIKLFVKGEEAGTKELLEVDATCYVRFPQDENLIKVLRAGVPISEEMASFFDAEVRRAFLTYIQRSPSLKWKEVISNVEKLREEAEKILRQPDSLFVQAGLGNSPYLPELKINEIRFPQLGETLSDPEKARLRSGATVIEVGRTLVQVERQLTGESVSAVHLRIAANPKEMSKRAFELLKLRQKPTKEKGTEDKVRAYKERAEKSAQESARRRGVS